MSDSLKNTDVQQRVLHIVESVTGLSPEEIDLHQNLDEEMSFDSMQIIAVMARVEKEFGISFPLSIQQIQTLNDFLSIVQTTVANKKK